MLKTIIEIQPIMKNGTKEYNCRLTCGHIKVITGYKPELYSKVKCYECLP